MAARKVYLILAFIVFSTLIVKTDAQSSTVPTYNLSVRVGDWAEYSVEKVIDYQIYDQEGREMVYLKQRDVIKIIVLSVEGEPIPYIKHDGTEVFGRTPARFDVYLNGKLIAANVLYCPGVGEAVYPGGNDFWAAYKMFYQEYYKNDPYYSFNAVEATPILGSPVIVITFQRLTDYIFKASYVYSQSLGVLLEYSFTSVRDTTQEVIFKLVNTSIPGVLSPWYVVYWYIFPIVVGAILPVFYFVRKKRHYSKKNPQQ